METFVILYFHVWVLVKYSFQGEKALATRPPEEQPGELSTFCKLQELYYYVQLKMWAADYAL